MKCPQCGKEQPDTNLLCANPACNVDFHSLARVKQERAEAAAARAAATAREAQQKELAAADSARRRNAAKDLALLLALVLAGLSVTVIGGYFYAMRADARRPAETAAPAEGAVPPDGAAAQAGGPAEAPAPR